MGIINKLPAGPPASVDQLGQQKLARMRARNTQLYNAIVNTVKQNMAEVWSDADQVNFSAQQVFNLIGTDGTAIVQASATLCALVNAQTPGALPTDAPQALTFNSDGTVTVGS